MTPGESALANPLRVVLVGAGLMGRAWLDTIEAAPDVELRAGATRSLTRAAREKTCERHIHPIGSRECAVRPKWIKGLGTHGGARRCVPVARGG
jgi:predicted homoserine dehydrogenase-like protein